MTSSYTILLLFQVEIHSTVIFISQDLVYFNHITSNDEWSIKGIIDLPNQFRIFWFYAMDLSNLKPV